jgi:selT/selW/selH-like putative selenoprotein
LIWLVGIAILLGGTYICKLFNIAEPPFFAFIKQNPFQVFIALFVINSFGASQMSTGAFEISIDGQLVFSKLAYGQLPSGTELISGMQRLGYSAIAGGDRSS